MRKPEKLELVAVIALLVLLAACSELQEPALRIGSAPRLSYQPLQVAAHYQFWDDSQFQVVDLANQHQVMNALRFDVIHAAVLPLSAAMQLAREGTAVSIVMVLAGLEESNRDETLDVLIVKPEQMLSHRQKIPGLLSAWDKSLRVVASPDDDVLQLMRGHLQMDAVQLQQALLRLRLFSASQSTAALKKGEAIELAVQRITTAANTDIAGVPVAPLTLTFADKVVTLRRRATDA